MARLALLSNQAFATYVFPLAIVLHATYCHEHYCGYRSPSPEEILPPVNLDADDIDFSYTETWPWNHVADSTPVHSNQTRSTSLPLHVLRKRSVNRPAGEQWRQLRIHITYHAESFAKLSSEQTALVKNVVIPNAVGFWSQSLRVRRAISNRVLLNRDCQSSSDGEHVRMYPSAENPSYYYCKYGCAKATQCGEIIVPDEHLVGCRTPNGRKERDGEGVDNADFILYVSAIATERCEKEKTVAYAAHCEQEVLFDRPIAGHANICPHAIRPHEPSAEQTLVATVKHEVLHALGFSHQLFAFFRDERGAPRTERRRDNAYRPEFDHSLGVYSWSNKTVREVVRNDWLVASGNITRKFYLLVTPRVVAEVRRHFDCPTLEGAELEQQGGNGTAYTHFEKRLFENEAMVGVHTQNPAYSRLTFALLEDSGWYKPNYTYAEPLHWGYKLGCDFAQHSCMWWMQHRAQLNLTAEPFCTTPRLLDMKHTRCSNNRDALAICNLQRRPYELPAEYQNFASIPGVPQNDVKHYGGAVSLADYCPFLQEFTWAAPEPGSSDAASVGFATASGQPPPPQPAANSADYYAAPPPLQKSTDADYAYSNSTSVGPPTARGSKCVFGYNQPDMSVNVFLERYEPRSVCVEHSMHWTECESDTGRARKWAHWGSSCYPHVCDRQTRRLVVVVWDRNFTCYKTGQRYTVRINANGWHHQGDFVCPPCEELCEKSNEDVLGITDLLAATSQMAQNSLPFKCAQADEIRASMMNDEILKWDPVPFMCAGGGVSVMLTRNNNNLAALVAVMGFAVLALMFPADFWLSTTTAVLHA